MRLLKLLLCTRRKTQKMLQYVKMPACKSLFNNIAQLGSICWIFRAIIGNCIISHLPQALPPNFIPLDLFHCVVCHMAKKFIQPLSFYFGGFSNNSWDII